MKVEIYCGHYSCDWVEAGITEPEIWNNSDIRNCEDNADGYRYYYDDEGRTIYRIKLEEDTMKEKEVKERLEAGESPTDISVDKYRQLYCKVMRNEKVIVDDVCSDTCALCQAYDCEDCTLYLNGDGCTAFDNSPWRKLTGLLRQKEYDGESVTRRQILDAIDNMIKALKDAKKFEIKEPEPRAEILNDDNKWVESLYTDKNIKAIGEGEVVPITSTNEHDYYANLKWQTIYRVKKEQT